MRNHRSVLIIAPDFPPLNKISSLRPYYFARAFIERGWDTTVVAEITDGVPNDLKRPEEGIQVLRVRSKNRMVWTARAALSLAQLRARGMRYDLVVSTHGPSSAHLLGFVAKAVWPKARWIADYRDLWKSGQYYCEEDKNLYRQAASRFERALLLPAAALTTVSQGLAQNLSAFHKKGCTVIYNGFEEPRPSEPRKQSAKVRIVYTGIIYAERNPIQLLQAIAGNEKTRNRVEVVIAGHVTPNILESYRPFVASGVLRYCGELTRAEAYELQATSDCNLLVENLGASQKGVIPGKIFEYLAAGRPVLTMGVDPNSEVVNLVRDAGLLTWASSNDEDLSKFVESLVVGQTKAAQPNSDYVRRFDRMAQSRRFVELAESLLGAR